MPESPDHIHNRPTDEIDLAGIIRKVWIGRKTVIITLLVCVIAGVAWYGYRMLIVPARFESRVTGMIESTSISQDDLVLTTRKGDTEEVIFAFTRDSINPELLPLIVSSSPFLNRIGNIRIPDPGHGSGLDSGSGKESETGAGTGSDAGSDQGSDDGSKPGTGSDAGSKPGTGSDAGSGQGSDDGSKPGTGLESGSDQGSDAGSKPGTGSESGIGSEPNAGSEKAAESGTGTGSLITVFRYLGLENAGSQERQDALTGMISAKTGPGRTLTLQVVMPDPVIATIVADSAAACLTPFMQQFSTRKAAENLNFIIGLRKEADSAYLATLQAITAFHEGTSTPVLQRKELEEKRLQAAYKIALDRVSFLSRAVEKAEFRLQAQTPSITIVQPANTAARVEVPNLLLVLVVALFCGFLAGILILYLKGIQWSPPAD